MVVDEGIGVLGERRFVLERLAEVGYKGLYSATISHLPRPLIPYICYKAVCIGVRVRSNLNRTAVPVELRIVARGSEVPGTHSRAREPEFPGVVSVVEHLRRVRFAAPLMLKCDRRDDIEGVAAVRRVLHTPSFVLPEDDASGPERSLTAHREGGRGGIARFDRDDARIFPVD